MYWRINYEFGGHARKDYGKNFGMLIP